MAELDENGLPKKKDRPFYEQWPYIYLSVALACFMFSKKSIFLIIPGLMFLVAGILVLNTRHNYRKKMQEYVELMKKLTK